MTAPVKQASAKQQADRPVYRTSKRRAEDLAVGDVTRNSFGKWARVLDVRQDKDIRYYHVTFDSNDGSMLRDVALVDVQEVKPS